MKSLPNMLKESFCIHDMNDDRLYEMAKIGRFKDLYIYIWMNDGGNVPHFHISDSANYPQNSTIEISVKIQSAEYFPHGNKYEDQLNSKQKKELVKFFNSKTALGVSNWMILIDTWNRNNSSINLPISTPMPDYTKLS